MQVPTLTRGGVGQGKEASPNTPMGVGLPGKRWMAVLSVCTSVVYKSSIIRAHLQVPARLTLLGIKRATDPIP